MCEKKKKKEKRKRDTLKTNAVHTQKKNKIKVNRE